MNTVLSLINVSWVFPVISKIFLFFDAIVYAILQASIEIFFAVGSMDYGVLTEGLETVVSNVNTLVGIYIAFRISILFLSYLIDPEKFKDAKTGGGAFVKDLVLTLVMLVLLNSGILFGTLNDIQKVVFNTQSDTQFEVLDSFGLTPSKDNMIAKIVFGNNGFETNITNQAHIIAVKIFEQFLYIYEDADTKEPKGENGWFSYSSSANVFSAEDILGSIAQSSNAISFFDLILVGGIFTSFSKVQYTAILSTAFAIYMLVRFFKYGIAIVIRFLKLIILQMISPIAIVSYAIPKGKKTFQSFWSAYFSLYFELFIRLLSVYIMIYLMGMILSNSFVMLNGFGFFTKMALKILLLIAIDKFTSQLPSMIASIFGGKVGEESQRSFGRTLGGVLGAGVFGGARLGGAIAGGSTLGGALWAGLSGGVAGARSGANSSGLFDFGSRALTGVTSNFQGGYAFGQNGGLMDNARLGMDRSFGWLNSQKQKATEFDTTAKEHTTNASNLDAIKDAAQKQYLKDQKYASKDEWINSQLGVEDAQISVLRERIKNSPNNAAGLGAALNRLEGNRAQRAFELSEQFDKNVDACLANNIDKGFKTDATDPDKINGELAQAYSNYNEFETKLAAKENRAARTITYDTQSMSTDRKAKAITERTEATAAQQERDKIVMDERYIKASRGK